MDSKPVCHPSPAKIIKCSFLDYVQLLMIGRAVWWTWTLSATLSSQKNKMLTFGLRSTSDDQASLVNGLRSCPPPLSSQKIKCSFLDYIQLLMFCRAGWWTSTPSATLSSQKNKMLVFGLHSTSDDWLGWSIDSNPIHHPSPAKKIKCSFLDYVQLLMIGRAGWWTSTPSATLSSQKNKILVFGLHSTSDDWLGWSLDSNPIHHPSPAKKIKCSFLDYVQLLMIGRAGWWTLTPSVTPLQSKK